MKSETIEKSETRKDIGYYLSLPYTTILRRDDAGDVIARIEELPGCIAHGKNETKALSNLASMKRMWFEEGLEGGDSIPEPEEHQSLPSGKWVQRTPRSLHAQLTRMARSEGVSLNQLVTSMLSERASARSIHKDMEQMIVKYVSQALSRGAGEPAAIRQSSSRLAIAAGMARPRLKAMRKK